VRGLTFGFRGQESGFRVEASGILCGAALGSQMSLGVVTDRLLRTHTSNHDLLKTVIGLFATVEPILRVLGNHLKSRLQ